MPNDLTDFCVQVADTLDARGEQYGYENGEPDKHFADIAMLWSVILKRPVAPYEVILCLDALKTARLINNPTHADSWLDKAGYTAIGANLVTLSEQSPDNAIRGCDMVSSACPCTNGGQASPLNPRQSN